MGWLEALWSFPVVGTVLQFLQFSSDPRMATCQASQSITQTCSLFKCMCMESVMPSNHIILNHPLLLLPSIFLSIRDFYTESALPIKWSKYWSFNFRDRKSVV